MFGTLRRQRTRESQIENPKPLRNRFLKISIHFSNSFRTCFSVNFQDQWMRSVSREICFTSDQVRQLLKSAYHGWELFLSFLSCFSLLFASFSFEVLTSTVYWVHLLGTGKFTCECLSELHEWVACVNCCTLNSSLMSCCGCCVNLLSETVSLTSVRRSRV